MPSAGFARKWASDESFIEKNGRRAIYDVLKADSRRAARIRQKRGLPPHAGGLELLGGYGCNTDEEYFLCLALAGGDLLMADTIYRTWDIKEVFEKQAYKLSLDYREPDLPND